MSWRSGALTAQSLGRRRCPTRRSQPSPAPNRGNTARSFRAALACEDRTDFSFFMVGGHLGKVLTPQLGHRRSRGQHRVCGGGVPALAVLHAEVPAHQLHRCCTGLTAEPALSARLQRSVHRRRNLYRRRASRRSGALELHPRQAVHALDPGRGRCRLDEPQVSCGRRSRTPMTRPRRAQRPIPACGTSRRRVESAPITS